MVFSFLGVMKSTNIYLFSIQLLIAVNLSETLHNIVRAISLRINQLLTTFMFLFIIIYFFSFIAFFFFSKDFIKTLEGNQENTCGSLLYCFLTHMNIILVLCINFILHQLLCHFSRMSTFFHHVMEYYLLTNM